jgi:putative transposase
MIQTTEVLGQNLGLSMACDILRVPRSAIYVARQPAPMAGPVKPSPERALSETERTQVRETLNSERFVDCAPRAVYATLLDEETYLCSASTMYRILAENSEIRERRDQLRHPNYAKPELLATGPNQVWTWDITKLLGPTKWTYFYLYVMLDIFSRYVVGWLLADRESSHLAEALMTEACLQQNIQPNQLTIHADRGSPMIAKPVALLLADLGVLRSHSRPHVSNDNPFSEAQFKTLKYRPDYPKYFGSQFEARTWSRDFFPWYNTEHRHSGIGYFTPAAVHYGTASRIFIDRQRTLQLAYTAHPERFVKGLPVPPALPTAVWINPPKVGAGPTPAVVEAGDPVGNSERSAELSTSPQSQIGALIANLYSPVRQYIPNQVVSNA